MPLTAPEETVEIHGYALREFRVLKGLNPRELAETIGCDRSYITKIELGTTRRVSRVMVNKLSLALGLKDSRALMLVRAGSDVDAA